MSAEKPPVPRSKTVRFISRTFETPKHSGEIHGGPTESLPVCDEGRDLPSSKRARIQSSVVYGVSDEEEVDALATYCTRADGSRSEYRRGIHQPRRLYAPKPKQSASLRELSRSAKQTIAVCRGPTLIGPCSACRNILAIMERRNCFLAEPESEEDSGSSTDPIVDCISSEDGEDLDDAPSGEDL